VSLSKGRTGPHSDRRRRLFDVPVGTGRVRLSLTERDRYPGRQATERPVKIMTAY
jgi:hypothetical protein